MNDDFEFLDGLESHYESNPFGVEEDMNVLNSSKQLLENDLIGFKNIDTQNYWVSYIESNNFSSISCYWYLISSICLRTFVLKTFVIEY